MEQPVAVKYLAKRSEAVVKATFKNQLIVLKGLRERTSLYRHVPFNLIAAEETARRILDSSKPPFTHRRRKALHNRLECVEMYCKILVALMDVYQGDMEDVVAVIYKAHHCAKTSEPHSCSKTHIETNLYWLFQLLSEYKFNFGKFHLQALAFLLLQEFRVKNGLLIGRYNTIWPNGQSDAHNVYQFVLRMKEDITIAGMRQEIVSKHLELCGITGM